MMVRCTVERSALCLGVLIALFGILSLPASADPGAWDLQSEGNSDDGLTDQERQGIYGSLLTQKSSGRAEQLDLIIVDRTLPNAFFGLYRTSQMGAMGWYLYERTVDWANGFKSHATTKVWLATYNGTLDPKYSGELDGIAVYDHLINTMGFLAANIHVDHQSTIETGNFAGYDLVLYVCTYPRNATNVMNQQKPFVTTCAGETDEMGIGTGVELMHQSRNYMWIVDNTHFVTGPFALGYYSFASSMWMDATRVAGNGLVLVQAEAMPLWISPDMVDASVGGTVTYTLTAGAVNANRPFIILSSVTGMGPVNLPDGTPLPLTLDAVTSLLLSLNIPGSGVLSGSGNASVNLPIGSFPLAFGFDLFSAYVCPNKPGVGWYASNGVKLQLVP